MQIFLSLTPLSPECLYNTYSTCSSLYHQSCGLSAFCLSNRIYSNSFLLRYIFEEWQNEVTLFRIHGAGDLPYIKVVVFE